MYVSQQPLPVGSCDFYGELIAVFWLGKIINRKIRAMSNALCAIFSLKAIKETLWKILLN